ncbi:hypothetical protein Tco_0043214 [Tanacetum coccineum]
MLWTSQCFIVKTWYIDDHIVLSKLSTINGFEKSLPGVVCSGLVNSLLSSASLLSVGVYKELFHLEKLEVESCSKYLKYLFSFLSNNMDTFLFHFTKPPDHCSKGESILTIQAPFLNVHKTFDRNRSSLGLHGNDVCSHQFRPRSSSNDF